MAYADQQMSGNRVVAIIIVALIHIALGYALITGLAYNAVQQVVERVTLTATKAFKFPERIGTLQTGAAADVTVIDLSPNDMSVALIRGDIDAFAWTGQAANAAEKQSGGKTTVMNQDGLEKYFQSHQTILTSEKVIKEKPQLLDAAVKAIFAAEEYMAKDASWPQKIAARVRTTPEEVKSATESFQFRIEFTPRFLDDVLHQLEQCCAGFLIGQGENVVSDGSRRYIHVSEFSWSNGCVIPFDSKPTGLETTWEVR